MLLNLWMVSIDHALNLPTMSQPKTSLCLTIEWLCTKFGLFVSLYAGVETIKNALYVNGVLDIATTIITWLASYCKVSMIIKQT